MVGEIAAKENNEKTTFFLCSTKAQYELAQVGQRHYKQK